MPPQSKYDDEQFDEQDERNTKPSIKLAAIHPTNSLTLLNFIDMFSVALVVPLLNQYYKDAGISSASLRELLSSLFSGSQILGSVVMGALSDCGILSRKHILYISFLGSALSYSLIVLGGVHGMIISRVIVGSVKQTSTISTSMISSYTSPQERSRYIGRLSSCSTGAFIIGPSIGGYLYKNVDNRAPALLASALFVFNFVLAAILLPTETQHKKEENSTIASLPRQSIKNLSKPNKLTNFVKNLKTCFSSKDLSAVIISTLIYNWISRATSYASMPSFYEQMFSIESHQRGYLSSYTAVLALLFQTFFLQYALKFVGGEYAAACVASGAIVVATLFELTSSLHLFLLIVCPIVAVANSMLRLSLRSLVTQIAPAESLGSILAALDVMRNAVSVSVPFYRTALFNVLTYADQGGSGVAMKGDPDPTVWLRSSLMHLIVSTAIIIRLLMLSNKQGGEKKNM